MLIATRRRLLLLTPALPLALQAAPIAPIAPVAPVAPDDEDIAPEALGRDLDGQQRVASDARGQVQLICQWASWCGYCKQLTPVLENLQRRVGAEAMRTLLITQEDRDAFRNLARYARRELKLQFLHDPGGRSSAAWESKGFPFLAVVDHDLRVRRSFSGYSPAMLDAIVAAVNGALQARALALSDPA